MLKRVAPIALLACCCASLTGLGAPHAKPFARNRGPVAARPHLGKSTTAAGLAPTTWGFVSAYSGTAYGTGYYALRVDLTSGGTNSIFGYTYNYPAYGFQNDIKAVYAFDLSGITGSATPVWSSFMFDVRERPPVGSSGASVFANMQLNVASGGARLTGLSLFVGDYATNLDVFNAEDFENAAPFDSPDLGFVGTNPLIGTIPVSSGTIIPIDFDVSSAVSADMMLAESIVPALGTVGLAGFAALVLAAGVFFVRRNGLA